MQPLFWFQSTIPHSILIRLLGHVYYSCSQHLNRTGSSYQCIKTDQNKSGSYLDLCAAVTTHEQYNILYSLQCYNYTKYWLYKVIYNNKIHKQCNKVQRTKLITGRLLIYGNRKTFVVFLLYAYTYYIITWAHKYCYF